MGTSPAHTHRLKAVGLVRGDNPNRLYNAQNQKAGPTYSDNMCR